MKKNKKQSTVKALILAVIVILIIAMLVMFYISFFANKPNSIKSQDKSESENSQNILLQHKGDGYVMYYPNNYVLKEEPVFDNENEFVYENTERSYIPDREHVYFTNIKPIGYALGSPTKQICEVFAKDLFKSFSAIEHDLTVEITSGGNGVGCKNMIKVYGTEGKTLIKVEKVLWRSDDPEGKLYKVGIRYYEEQPDQLPLLNDSLIRFTLN